ncbi:sugar transferase [Candidatus Woesearchaeota archaeon]|nr:sugar transferase [Candidatus Woesearchaeota archaeon]
MIYEHIKRGFDIVVSGFLLIILSPLILFISLMILIFDGGPLVFKHPRVGKDKKLFMSYKFRTMVNNAERRDYGLSSKESVTRTGGFLRATHLDELLQLVNVFKGDISLIGPRPLDIERYLYLIKKNKNWNNILKAKPGITCINQLCRYHTHQEQKIYYKLGQRLKKRDRLLLDNYYVNHRGLILDIRVFVWTLNYLSWKFFSTSVIETKKGLLYLFGKK